MMPKRMLAKRYHDVSVGHRVVGHEGKCRFLHGHNYRVTFHVAGEELDALGRVLDFGQIKSTLCEWLEENWDHKFLADTNDPLVNAICKGLKEHVDHAEYMSFLRGIVWVPFNPTAEKMAEYLVEVIGPMVLEGTGCVLVAVEVGETAKCSVLYTKEGN